jgi:hypothetical protein
VTDYEGLSFFNYIRGYRTKDRCTCENNGDLCEYCQLLDEVKTECIRPPIPIRNFDWVAWIDGEEENGKHGYGETEKQATDDLLTQLGEED